MTAQTVWRRRWGRPRDGDRIPNLGFDPAPGQPGDVENLAGVVGKAAGSLTQAGELLNRVREGDAEVWQGEAATAFRSTLDQTVIADLSRAQESLTRAVGVLRGWHGDLEGFREQAAMLEREAGEARQAEDAARCEYQKARSSPDLGLAGRTFTDPQALREAQARLDAAEAAVGSAGARVDAAETRRREVLRRARELQEDHAQAARRAAKALLDAERRLAPQAAGLLKSIGQGLVDAAHAVGDWVEDHLSEIHSVLATTAAIAGLLAVLTPPPIDAIALGVAVVASAGALATDLADPKFRHQVGRLLHGHFDGDSIGAVMKGAGDALGVVPAAGMVSKAVTGAGVVAEGASSFPRVVEIASTVAHAPGLPAKLIAKLPQTGQVLEGLRLIDAGSGAYRMITENMVNILWKGKGVLSNVKTDIQQAVQ